LSIEATMAPVPSKAAANYDLVVIGSGVGGYTAGDPRWTVGPSSKVPLQWQIEIQRPSHDKR
jgi:hypothetical protein